MTENKFQKADILIENGWVITMDDQGTQYDRGAVAIDGDRIVAVGHGRDLSHWNGGKVIDAGGGIIMPGLVNVHTHAAMTCFRGLADDLPLMTWLNDHIFPAEATLDDNKVYLGTLLACAEMIRSGTTCFCDMYLFEDAVARAAHTAGLRAVVGEVLYDFPSPNYGPIEKGFEYTRELIDTWRDDPLITIAVEPHSPYLCSADLLKKAADMSRQHAIPLVIHVAETTDEVARSRTDHGRTPVAYLESIGVLSSNLLACHCVHLQPADIERLRKHDVKVAHNPESNMKLASGIAPVPELQKAGVCIGLGTDGCASNNDLDMFSEMDTAAKLHKVHSHDPTVMAADTVLKMATIDGARALGLDGEIGSIEPGKQADVIVLDTRKPHLTPMYHPISHLVYAAKGSDVTASVVNGQVLMEEGRLLTLDIDDIFRDVGNIAEEIRGKGLQSI
ncbi:S-adenosylhomocysteine deaminase (EC; Methylthioadenosine deaminase (EC [Olavius algarvensis associated proteobacterium Delta 3]|nr:S-adenosylhomocysteine deaminase (EC; Methylthioadenosine deaminase (EC [Olavius algarvensis associated proteobacterium Delta 3]CAB5150073.1 S-adenosylhomocysteine deaminase (EC; Methylthioadenosine deaminase (EC [Olavius algarvensis associated proteobacterium Delta 3]